MQQELREILRCPRCKSRISAPGHLFEPQSLRCMNHACTLSASDFPTVQHVPVLIDFSTSVTKEEDFTIREGESSVRRSAGLMRKLGGFVLRTHYPPTETNAARFLTEVKSLASRPNILVVGGGEIGNHARRLYNDDNLNLFGSDIYYSPHIDVIADGHALPISDASLHGVWIQAVLEHVLDPVKVVSEIHRVLVDGGIVYAETPFLEAVHEGPYDFTRFSLSGHRWLFRAFEEIQSGCIGGPGTALVWSIRYFVGALFRNYKIGTLVAMMFFWISYMDKLVGQRYTVDSPSGTYFLGRRSNVSIDTSTIISYYNGAQV